MIYRLPPSVDILAAVAEHERELISKRTREALAAAKARGVILGGPRIKELAAERVNQAVAFAESLRAEFQGMQGEGMTQRDMVDALNIKGIKAPRGGEWALAQVQRVLKRLKAA